MTNKLPNILDDGAFAIVWRQGGERRCRWTLVLRRFESPEAAKVQADEIEAMGYKTLIHPTRFLRTIGMPVGWDATTSAEDWHNTGSGDWFELREGGAR